MHVIYALSCQSPHPCEASLHHMRAKASGGCSATLEYARMHIHKQMLPHIPGRHDEAELQQQVLVGPSTRTLQDGTQHGQSWQQQRGGASRPAKEREQLLKLASTQRPEHEGKQVQVASLLLQETRRNASSKMSRAMCTSCMKHEILELTRTPWPLA